MWKTRWNLLHSVAAENFFKKSFFLHFLTSISGGQKCLDKIHTLTPAQSLNRFSHLYQVASLSRSVSVHWFSTYWLVCLSKKPYSVPGARSWVQEWSKPTLAIIAPLPWAVVIGRFFTTLPKLQTHSLKTCPLFTTHSWNEHLFSVFEPYGFSEDSTINSALAVGKKFFLPFQFFVALLKER